MITLSRQGVLRTADDVRRVVAYVTESVSREDILASAETMFRTYTNQGALGAFPGRGGVAGAFVMRFLREITLADLEDAGDYEIMLRDATVLILDHYEIPGDYVPPRDLVREGIALLVHVNEVVRLLSGQNDVEFITEQNDVEFRTVWNLLSHEASHLIAAGKSPQDAYLLPDVTVDSVLAAFKSVPARKS